MRDTNRQPYYLNNMRVRFSYLNELEGVGSQAAAALCQQAVSIPAEEQNQVLARYCGPASRRDLESYLLGTSRAFHLAQCVTVREQSRLS